MRMQKVRGSLLDLSRKCIYYAYLSNRYSSELNQAAKEYLVSQLAEQYSDKYSPKRTYVTLVGCLYTMLYSY